MTEMIKYFKRHPVWAFTLFVLAFMIGSSDSFGKTYQLDKQGPYQMTQVDRYLDGDTFEGWVSNWIHQTTFVRVRIRDIDAPETRGSTACEQEIGQRAKKYLMSLLENSKYVILDNVQYDNFGRVLASVRIEQGDVGELMIRASLAHPYEFRNESWCSSG